MKRFAWLGVALAIAVACGSDENVSETSPVHDAGTDAPVVPKPDSSTLAVKRHVFQKNPFGNVAASDNTLWDGDFEWASPFVDQYGWVDAVQIIGVSAFTGIRASAECRSGLKCAFVTQNQRLAGIGVAPGGKKASASIWARPPTGKCEEMTISLIACDYADDPDLEMKDADDAPDADGWCHYEAISDVRQSATCIYVVADFVEGEALLDDGVVRAAPDNAVPTSIAPSPTQRARIVEARKVLREKLKPRPSVPTRAKQELDRWLARKR
jgi:hypothetical protein